MCLTETWLGSDGVVSLIEASPPRYVFSQVTRQNKKGGGLASIYVDSFNCKQITLGDFSTFEHLALLLRYDTPILIVVIYRPPKQSPVFLQEFSDLLSIISTDYDRSLLVGDFNLHVDNESKSRNFVNLLSSLDFTQHITEPTHNKGHTLDLIISKGLDISVSSVLDLAVSDHYCIFFKVMLNMKQKNVDRIVKKRCLNSSANDKFMSLVNLISAPLEILSVDNLVESFNNKLRTTLDIIAPEKI